MMRAGMRMGGGGRVQFTPLTKMLLMFLVGLFIVQKVLESFVGFSCLPPSVGCHSGKDSSLGSLSRDGS